MARSRRYQKGHLTKQGDWWKLRWYEGVFDPVTCKAKRKQATPYTIGRCRGPGSLTKREAEKAQREKMEQVNAQSGPQAGDSMGLIGEFVEKRFNPAYVTACAKSGQLHYKNLLKKHILPAFRDMPPDELKADTVQKWINTKSKKFGRNYVTQMRNCLGTVYNFMARCGYEGRNPAQGVKIPREARKPKKTRPYKLTELATLLLHLSKRPPNCPLWTMHVLGATTSMHGAEHAGLRIENVNLSGEDVWMEDQDVPHGSLYVLGAYSKNEYTEGKNDYRHRVLPIPDALHEKVRACFYHPETGELRDPSEPLFVMPGTWLRHKKALPIDTQNVTTRVFKKIEAKVGFEVNWHRLRATYATITKTLGMDDQDRQDAMGHATLAMTESYTDQTERMRLVGNKIAEQIIGSEAVQ